MGRPTKLTVDVQAKIVAYIKAGSYDWIAAQACGIDPKTFANWIKWGRGGNPTYLPFFLEVSQARAQARVLAETEVRRDNPLAWLRYGPGRERAGEPGWTESHEVTGADGGPIQTQELSALSVTDLLSLVEAARAGAPAAIPKALTDAESQS